jgi:hypothetical protein
VGTRGCFSGGKRLGREANHSPPSRAKVKEWVELYLHSPNTPSWRGAQLKHRDNFYRKTSTPVEAFITLKGRQVPFVNHVEYLGIIPDKKKNLHGDYL